MLVERMEQYERPERRVDHPLFGLTLDVGHVHCLGDGEPADRIRQFAGRLFNVHIEDMCAGVHDHRMFGEGEMRFEPIIAALDAVGYDGCVCVELSRHSHDAVRAAQQAYEYVSRLIR